MNIIDGDQLQKIASDVSIEKAFISGDSLLLVLQRSIEEAMRDEPQEIVGLNLKGILQDETPYIRLADIESRIQTISYDIYYPKPIGNGAYLAFIPSKQKDALSLIQINEQQELEMNSVHEFDRIGKFIPLNEHECLLHFPTYKEDHSRNILYRISWR
ncbi:MAG: hypothetical protein Q4P65_02475 [Eubacteriales bacterium]|nr:hypothetical protein [Eubacteriales bacterium]